MQDQLDGAYTAVQELSNAFNIATDG